MFNLKKKEKEKKYTYLMCINQSAFQKLKRPYFHLFIYLFLRFSFQNLPESKGVFLLSLSPSTRSSQHRNEKQVVCLKKKRERQRKSERNKKSPRGSRSGTCPGLIPVR